MRELLSEFTDPQGERGYVTQAFDEERATYVMVDALMTSTRWIPNTPPLVPDRGVPAFTYMTIRLMKRFGIGMGTLRRLVVRGNHHVESVLQLAHAERSGYSPDEVVRSTRSFLSVETPMVQSGHRVSAVRVHGGRHGPIAALLDWHDRGGSALRQEIARDRSAEHALLLAKFARSRDDVVFYDYEMHLDLVPWA